jgi:hypothetical protein
MLFLEMKAIRKSGLPLRHALRIKTAEVWLEVGRPVQALEALQALPRRIWAHPWVNRVRQNAVEALN